MNELKKMKKLIKKNEREERGYEGIKQRILDEVYFQQHVLGKLFLISNIFKVDNKYHIEMKIKGRKKQDERLLDYIHQYLHENPIFLDFLNENMNRKEPLEVQLYYNRDFKPILLVNKRGFHFIDFLSYLHNKNVVLNDFTFMTNNPRKIF